MGVNDIRIAVLNQGEAIRALKDAHGDEALKIWATEYGVPTNPQLSETEQAAFVHEFVVSCQGGEGAGPIFVYTTRDANTGGFDDEGRKSAAGRKAPPPSATHCEERQASAI